MMEHLGKGITLLPDFEKIPFLVDPAELIAAKDEEGSFDSFPERHGWRIKENGQFQEKSCYIHKRHARKIYHSGYCLDASVPYERTEWGRFTTFLQRWLFFEVLREFFKNDDSVTFQFSDFITAAPGNAGKNFVTTRKLNEYLSNWRKRQYDSGWRGTSKQKARLIRLQRVLSCARSYIANHCDREAAFFWYIDKDVALSLIVLGETLTQAMTKLQGELEILPKGWCNLSVDQLHFGYSKKVLDEFENRRWCKRLVFIFENLMKGNTIGLLLILPHLPLRSHLHRQCTAEHCFGSAFEFDQSAIGDKNLTLMIEPIDKYDTPEIKTVHMGPMFCKSARNSSVQCDMKTTDTSSVCKIIQKGGVPLLWWDEENSVIQVEPMYNWDKEYIVISHVLIGLYGTNSIPECVAKAIHNVYEQALAKDVSRRPSRSSSELSLTLLRNSFVTGAPSTAQKPSSDSTRRTRYFWIDILAIPLVEEPQSESIRRHAVAQQHRILRNASYTVVLDSVLCGTTMSNFVTGAAKIFTSQWMGRLSTLPEGVLCQNLLFNFSDDLYSLEDIEYGIAAQEKSDGADVHNCISGVVSTCIDSLLGELRRLRIQTKPDEQIARTEFIASAWDAAQWRYIPEAAHQALALAILFDIDTECVFRDTRSSEMLTTKAGQEKPMEALYKQLGVIDPCSIPASIIFFPGEKLSKKAYSWAPLSWLPEKSIFLLKQLVFDAPASLSHLDEDGLFGLSLELPGLLIHALKKEESLPFSAEGFYFPTSHSLAEWYHVKPIERAETLPLSIPSHQTLGLMTMHWPLLREEEIALLFTSDEIISTDVTERYRATSFHVDIVSRVLISRTHDVAVNKRLRVEYCEGSFPQFLAGESIGTQSWMVGGELEAAKPFSSEPKEPHPLMRFIQRIQGRRPAQKSFDLSEIVSPSESTIKPEHESSAEYLQPDIPTSSQIVVDNNFGTLNTRNSPQETENDADDGPLNEVVTDEDVKQGESPPDSNILQTPSTGNASTALAPSMLPCREQNTEVSEPLQSVIGNADGEETMLEANTELEWIENIEQSSDSIFEYMRKFLTPRTEVPDLYGPDIEYWRNLLGHRSNAAAQYAKVSSAEASKRAPFGLTKEQIVAWRTRVISFIRLVAAAFGMVEPLLLPGFVRIRWICRCGHESYEDVPGNNTEQVVKITALIRSHPNILSAGSQPSNSARNSVLRTMQRAANNTWIRLRRRFYDRGGSRNIPLAALNAQSQILRSVDASYLLLCIHGRKYSVNLHHLNVESMKSDGELFRAIKSLYKRVGFAGSLSLRALKCIYFVRFTVYRKSIVDRLKHHELPPQPYWQDYDFEPKLELQVEPLPTSTLMHYFDSPHECDYDATYLKLFPKKIKHRLEWSSQRVENIGWGIHLAEAPHWGKAQSIMLLIMILGGLVYAILYGHFEKDWQTAFGMSAYGAACIALGLGAWQAGALSSTSLSLYTVQ